MTNLVRNEPSKLYNLNREILGQYTYLRHKIKGNRDTLEDFNVVSISKAYERESTNR